MTEQLGVKLDFLEPGNYGCIKQEKLLLEKPRKYLTYNYTIQAEASILGQVYGELI